MTSTAAPDEAGGAADRHLDRELAHDDNEGSVLVRGELDHPEHQSDPCRIVHARFALERRPRAALDLPSAEHREHHRRVGGGERRPDQAGQHPVEPEREVREHGDDPGGGERAEDPQRENRPGGSPKAPPADVHPAVEENHDQRHDRDPFHGPDRDVGIDRRPQVGDDRRGNEEDRRRRHRNAIADPRREHPEREPACDEEKDSSEVGDLSHGRASPTRLPGTPKATLAEKQLSQPDSTP